MKNIYNYTKNRQVENKIERRIWKWEESLRDVTLTHAVTTVVVTSSSSVGYILRHAGKLTLQIIFLHPHYLIAINNLIT